MNISWASSSRILSRNPTKHRHTAPGVITIHLLSTEYLWAAWQLELVALKQFNNDPYLAVQFFFFLVPCKGCVTSFLRPAGFANAQYDTCYHQSCDNLANINTVVLGDIAKTAAYAIQTLAMLANLQSFLAGSVP